MIERQFDIPMIAALALREKQIQQNYRPIIAVHKWFARRPGTLFRGLLLSEFASLPLAQCYYKPNQLPGIRVADPFMGGGTPLLEANRMGCDVIGFDINPMSYWIVRQEIEHLDLRQYALAARALRDRLEVEVGALYRTRCTVCGAEDAHVKYFLWVKVLDCARCGKPTDLFPGYLLSSDSRHPLNVFICPGCGALTETSDRRRPGTCSRCRRDLALDGPARGGRCVCPDCGSANSYPRPAQGPPRHRLFAIEYHCPACKPQHEGRFFKAPDLEDAGRARQAETRWSQSQAEYVPDDAIPSGDETNRLHRWGYSRYREMFNARQLLGLELSAEIVAGIQDTRVGNALATNLSDLIRYQNMLCRYDVTALKSLDIFSVHGFPVSLIQCESNLLGIVDAARNTCVGSGGWANIIEKFRRAKEYCDAPFEIRYRGRRKEVVPVKGEWIGDRPNGDRERQERSVELHCADAAKATIASASLDAVFTDPPYFGNVQYAELIDFCYVWLRRLVGDRSEGFGAHSTRNPQELTGNEAMGRGIAHFADGLSAVFRRMAEALKPGRPLAFTYHHNDLSAYLPVALAVLDAGLTCSASLPCPAEMGASIHISGTGSSIIDTVFVCRSTGSVPASWLVDSVDGLTALVRSDLAKLRAGGVEPTAGDMRCIAYGHLVRLAIWHLRGQWDGAAPISERLARVSEWLKDFGGWRDIEAKLTELGELEEDLPLFTAHEEPADYGAAHAEIPF
jgi:putative DNA methylase